MNEGLTPPRIAVAVIYHCNCCDRRWQRIYGKGEVAGERRVTDWNCADCLNRKHMTRRVVR
jgi:hypothetical protein